MFGDLLWRCGPEGLEDLGTTFFHWHIWIRLLWVLSSTIDKPTHIVCRPKQKKKAETFVAYRNYFWHDQNMYLERFEFSMYAKINTWLLCMYTIGRICIDATNTQTNCMQNWQCRCVIHLKAYSTSRHFSFFHVSSRRTTLCIMSTCKSQPGFQWLFLATLGVILPF